MDYLLKTEPSTYSFADLQREDDHLGRRFESRRAGTVRFHEVWRETGDLPHGRRKKRCRNSICGLG